MNALKGNDVGAGLVPARIARERDKPRLTEYYRPSDDSGSHKGCPYIATFHVRTNKNSNKLFRRAENSFQIRIKRHAFRDLIVGGRLIGANCIEDHLIAGAQS